MTTYRPDIDGLRSVAVVPVVIYHAGSQWLGGGFIGVDVFFVISGFLITSIIAPEIAEGRFSLLQFYERRTRRILPALFFVVALSLPAGAVLLLPRAFEDFAASVLATLAFSSNIWFWSVSTGYFAPAADLLPLLHTWSLAVEEQFYIFYPLALGLVLPAGRRATILALGTVMFVSLALAIWATPRMPAASFYLLPTRAWELGFGALVALGVTPKRLNRASREILSLFALAAILVPMFFYDTTTVFPGFAALPPVLGATLLIMIGTTGSSLVHRMLSLRVVVAVGLISYSLYLWHWPVLAFFRVLIGNPVLPPALATTAVTLSVLMSFLSWRYVERPFRNRSARRPIARTAMVGATLLAIAAGVILLGNGWPGRVSPEARAIDAVAQPTRFDRDCMRKYMADNVCRIGVPTSAGDPVDLVLIGDSHAAAAAEAVDAAAREAGLSGAFMGNVSCAPLVGVVAGTPENRSECARFMEAAVRFATETPGVRYVVLASRWPVLVEGTLMPGEPGLPFPVRLDPDVYGNTTEAPTNAEAVETALTATLEALAAGGAEVLLLGPVPELGWNVPEHLIAHLRWGIPMPPNPNLHTTLARQSTTLAILESAAAANQQTTTYIPVATELCTPECPTHDQTEVWYWDDDHLSPMGAVRLITPLLQPHITSK